MKRDNAPAMACNLGVCIAVAGAEHRGLCPVGHRMSTKASCFSIMRLMSADGNR
jgi:hypothetical protein